MVSSPPWCGAATSAAALTTRSSSAIFIVTKGTAAESDELTASTLYRHFRWSPAKMERTLRQLRARNLVHIESDLVSLTGRGDTHARQFRQTQLANESAGDLST